MNSNSVKFLLALKNASALKKEIVFFYSNNLFLKLAKVLYRTGLIQNFCIETKHNKKSQIVVSLKYSFNIGILNSLKIISKPSLSLFLEIFGTVVPALVLLSIAYPSFNLLYSLNDLTDPGFIIHISL